MLIGCPKCPLLTCFCQILPPWGVREAADHTSQPSLSQKPRRPTGQGQACPGGDEALLVDLSVV